MAKVYANLDFELLGEIQNAPTQKVTTAQRTTLAGTLTATQNILVFDTDLGKFYGWDGAAWVDLSQTVSSPMQIKGDIDASTNPAYPAAPATGDAWVITVAGTVGGVAVEPMDMLVRGQSGWFIVQANIQEATETAAGYIEIATGAETLAGTDDTRAVTPKKLSDLINVDSPRAKVHNENVNLVADTPYTLTHGLGLPAADAFACNVMIGGKQAIVDIESVDSNSIKLTSKKTTAAFVTVHGI